MQGYIIGVTRSRNEDVITTILTENKIKKLYRFYGARHSIINLGYKIDFITEGGQDGFLPRLRSVTELRLPFVADISRFLIWQQFLKLLERHLREVDTVEAFYFETLERSALKMRLQNPKRALIECYVEMLGFEGRAHLPNRCYRCEGKLEGNNVVVGRSFMGAHDSCEYGFKLAYEELEAIYEKKSTVHLEDKAVDELWKIVLRGF